MTHDPDWRKKVPSHVRRRAAKAAIKVSPWAQGPNCSGTKAMKSFDPVKAKEKKL